MDNEHQIKILKGLVIALAKAYQNNYETFADVHNFSHYVKERITEEQYRIILNIYQNFSMIQGFAPQALVSELATLDKPKDKVNLNHIRYIFGFKENEIHPTGPNVKSALENVKGFFETDDK